MTVRVISRDNGVGLSRDLHLIAQVLRDGGDDVQAVGFGGSQLVNRLREGSLWAARGLRGRVQTQLFVERVYQRCLPLARHNLLMPNPEWFLPKWQAWLPRFERVLCKTRHAEGIFAALGCRTVFTGFTSQDRLDASIAREDAFFHLAGRSSAKGTQVLLETWRQHPEWPRLTVLQHPKVARPGPPAHNIDHRIDYLDDATLRRLQNAHRFHLCPSEAEGFGHHLVEALGIGAVVLATDAAPMNELVTPDRGLLIRVARTRREGLVEHALVDRYGIEQAVEQALALDAAQCAQLGARARAFFLDNDRAFRQRLPDACRL
ncbi:glycosyltransferase [Cognatiluteimonas profundi]|uniref:glycosyltransferase n=1 Tax=Cognatiluteimonas profundi TaxID=2594501 RepID=UPI00131C07CB|nr:glycosyltransferase [Lysobacter profundi]